MRTLRIDFRSENILPDGCIAGRTGEHNATTLIITPPDEMLNSEEAKNFCIVFETGSEIIHSEVMVKAETLKISLWKQLTKNKCLAVQVEAYDSNGEFIAKSPTVSLILRPSLEGNKAQTDTENPDFISEFLKTKHSHENKDVLDKFGEAEDGSPIYNGKKIEGSEGVGITEEQAAELAENTKARHTHNNKDVLDYFGMNYAKTRPTFKSDDGITNTLATTDDVRSKFNTFLNRIPEKTSQLVNDSNFVTAEYVTKAINGSLDEVEAMIDESGVLDE